MTPPPTEQIWVQTSADLRAFILRRVNDPDDAEDILQETFIKIHNKLDTLRHSERLTPWVYQITRNAITDYYRRRRQVEPLPEEGFEEQWVEPDAPDDSVEGEVMSWLRPMVESLPDKYRQALLWTEFEGLSQKEVAERLGLSHSGAKSRVQRGRGMLKQQLVACCAFEFDRRGTIIDYTPHILLEPAPAPDPDCC